MAYLSPILLAEDDDDDSMFFEHAVQEIHPDLELIRYRDGVELMDRIAGVDNPGILFLDINMPRANGYQCLLQLRATKTFQELPIIIFSTAGSADLISKLYDAGADAFIVKPNDFNHWKSIVERTLNTDWKNFSSRDISKFVIKQSIDQ
jgi:CheY-like chemotaxis protein